MDSKHLGAGSTCPPLKDGKLRFYNMRFCPYAQRSVLVALAKEIPLDVVNVNLKEKPEWLFEKNPDAKVPTIETKQGSLYESLLVSDYFDEVYTNRPLYPKDLFKKTFDRIWIENASKITGGFYKIALAKDNQELINKGVKELEDALELFDKELKRRGTTFYLGNEAPGMLDYMIWPWIERLPMFNILNPRIDFDASFEKMPTLDRWRQHMKKDEAVEAYYVQPEDHARFVKSYFYDTKPNFDLLAK